MTTTKAPHAPRLLDRKTGKPIAKIEDEARPALFDVADESSTETAALSKHKVRTVKQVAALKQLGGSVVTEATPWEGEEEHMQRRAVVVGLVPQKTLQAIAAAQRARQDKREAKRIEEECKQAEVRRLFGLDG